MHEKPFCIVLAAARHRFGSPARRQAGWFCGMGSTVPEKEFLARRGRKNFALLRIGTSECVMRARNTHPIKPSGSVQISKKFR